MVQAVAAGAVTAGLLPKQAYAVTLPGNGELDCRLGLRRVGPLLPTPPQALKRWMGARYGAFLHWGPCTVLGKEISWSREVQTPPQIYDNLYKRFNPVEFDAEAWVRML
jgi:alpha-L-fucosidase